jgi:hypothetical protein
MLLQRLTIIANRVHPHEICTSLAGYGQATHNHHMLTSLNELFILQ